MNPFFRKAAVAASLSLALCLFATIVKAGEFKTGALVLQDPWSRATPKGAKIGAGYLKIANHGTSPDRLIAVTSPAAATVEIHEMTTKDGIMRMRPISGGLVIEPGKVVALEPNGYHIMLMGLKAPLKPGDRIPMTFKFEKSGTIEIQFDVQPIGASKPASMKEHKM